MSRRGLGFAALAIALIVFPSTSRAFSTRVHIVLSNQIRQALIDSGDGTIQLRWSNYAVQLPQADADAIVNQPQAFRAGAIGPDVVVFPAMTDGTHSIDQNPYGQCQLLYEEAFTEAERAYALGCFLHGATDAVAHHFVNYFTGETFTLNPLSTLPVVDFDNVVGHIVTESIIQSAVYNSDPGAFTAEQLDHQMEEDLVLRTYFNTDSPVWQRMTQGTMVKWRAVQEEYPPSPPTWPPQPDLFTWVTNADFHPWEHIAMAPQYIAELQTLRMNVRQAMVDRIAELAIDPDIDAQPGPDGMIGTTDDVTACSASCPATFGEYWILVHLLAPRFDTRGNPLPSAFDKISTDLGDDLYAFLPAFVQVISNLSQMMLNTPIGDDGDHGLDIDRDALAAMFTPIDDWAATTFAIDWETAGRAVSPEWYTDLSDFLDMFGVTIAIPDIIELLFGPILDEIRDALIAEVRDRAQFIVDDLRVQYEMALAPWTDAVLNRLGESEPAGLGGSAFDYIQDSGLIAHAFNLTAASLGNHEVLLVASDEVANGPASFDTSYTPEWTQAGLCDYLREAIFPHGLGSRPLLSVDLDGTYYESPLLTNSPIECHDGSLSMFGTPGPVSCAHKTLEELVLDPHGSITRGYPPEYAFGSPGCRNLVVPGLPDPPVLPGEDAGMTGDRDGGVGVDGGGGPDDGGCGCRAASSDASPVWLAIPIALFFVRRRRGAR